MTDQIRKRFTESADILRRTGEHLGERIAEAAEIIVASYRAGGGVFAFGNGGSAADAQHIVGELVGRFLRERRGLRAEALGVNASVSTSLGNDYDFESALARQLEANARAGDVAIGLSTSGNSPNVVAALKTARRIGVKTLALTGQGGGRCAEFADVLLDVPSDCTPRIQEAHAVIYHTLCECVDDAIAPEFPAT